MSGTSIRNSSHFKRLAAGCMVLSAASFISTSAANAADEIGKSVRVVNSVTGSMGNRQLSSSDPVFESERITAANDSHGELRLNDESRVLVGENSVISLDDFVVGTRGFESGTVKIAKGAFRFITGNSKKDAFTVQTPVSTIGSRGTIFDIYVGEDGIVQHVLFEGAIEVCSGGGCITIDRPCDIVEATTSSIEQKPYFGSIGNEESEDDQVLAFLQGRFTLPWRAPTITCSLRAAFDPLNKRPPGPRDLGKEDRPEQRPEEPEPEKPYSYDDFTEYRTDL